MNHVNLCMTHHKVHTSFNQWVLHSLNRKLFSSFSIKPSTQTISRKQKQICVQYEFLFFYNSKQKREIRLEQNELILNQIIHLNSHPHFVEIIFTHY